MGLFDFFKKKKEDEVLEETDNAVQTSEESQEILENKTTSEENLSEEVSSEEILSEEVLSEEVLSEEVLSEEVLSKEASPEPALPEDNLSEESTAEEVLSTDLETASDDAEVSEAPSVTQEKKGFFARLKEGLTKTRNNIVAGMDAIFSSDEKIDDEFYEELEEILILGDIGVHTTQNILEKLEVSVKKNHIKKRSDCKAFLIESIKEEMALGENEYAFENTQSIVFVIGVNGVGKTTSIGKLASHLKGQGKRVMLAACDTFRAAAGSQLEEWSHRAGVEMIGGKEGADPSSVLYDAVAAAKARNVDVLLVDTAGRLHNKKNLMEELKKMNRVIDKAFPEAHRENMIVLDASTGQNALNQAKEFGEVADLTGIILTKMDGTAKGGIAIAITSELKVPVKYIGVGERIEDLQKFNADTFVDALFDVDLSKDKDMDSADAE